MAIKLKSITFDTKFLLASLIIGSLAFSLYSYDNIEKYNTAKSDLNKAISECLIQKKIDDVICNEKEFLAAEKYNEKYSLDDPKSIWVRKLNFNEAIVNLPIEESLQFSIIKYYFILIMGYAFAIGIAPIFWKFLLKRITELVKVFKS